MKTIKWDGKITPEEINKGLAEAPSPEPPSVPGWYWFRDRNSRKWNAVEIVRIPAGITEGELYNATQERFIESMYGTWQGPIEEPNGHKHHMALHYLIPEPETRIMKEIGVQHLKDHGYDGVYYPGPADPCSCFLDDLEPCPDCFCECVPGHKAKVYFEGEMIDGIGPKPEPEAGES